MSLAKRAIAVYSPDDAIESAVQNAARKYLGEWLTSSACQLMARAINSLKIFDDWLDNDALLEQRISYFFAPYMTSNKQNMVFVTHQLFLRDIIENEEINAYNHDPVVFVTTPIAHYLLRDYTVHIHIDVGKMKSLNYRSKWAEAGGLIVSDGKSVKLDDTAILSIKDESSDMRKVAATWIGTDVFKLDEHESVLEPDAQVWDKRSRESAKVIEVEPGETGVVVVQYKDGRNKHVPKTDFDLRFVRLGPQSCNETFDSEYNKKMEVPVNE